MTSQSTAEPIIRLATRGSPLALWQARRIAELLAGQGLAASLVVVQTEGDLRTDVSIQSLGGRGVFAKEVQSAVVNGRADVAVHSAKDLPSGPDEQVDGLLLAAFPERADPRDLLVGARLHTLATGALVATGSARRRVQLANLRPDLLFTNLRGNLATRLAAVDDVSAVVVAAAGVDRLAWSAPPGVDSEAIDPQIMLPQVGQGALALECSVDDRSTREILARINDTGIHRAVSAERAFLAELGGGCVLPVGGHATLGEEGVLTLTGMLGSDDGRVVLRQTASGDDPEVLGGQVARSLIDDAGGRSLGEWGVAAQRVLR